MTFIVVMYSSLPQLADFMSCHTPCMYYNFVVNALTLGSKREEIPGRPMILKPFGPTFSKELNPGDHILYQVSQYPYRQTYYSALVIEIRLDTENAEHTILEVIANSASDHGVVEKMLILKDLRSLHKVVYSHQYEAQLSIQRAKKRINENHYHPLNNNGHHFVTWCKTGQEYSLQDLIKELENAGKLYYIIIGADLVKIIINKCMPSVHLQLIITMCTNT